MKRYAPEDRLHDDGPGPLFAAFDAPESHTLRERFLRFHEENPAVYAAFEKFCLEVAATGRRRVGAKMVWERMRWFSRFETTDPVYTLNNSYTAGYARMFLAAHPEMPDFFETRRLKGEDVA